MDTYIFLNIFPSFSLLYILFYHASEILLITKSNPGRKQIFTTHQTNIRNMKQNVKNANSKKFNNQMKANRANVIFYCPLRASQYVQVDTVAFSTYHPAGGNEMTCRNEITHSLLQSSLPYLTNCSTRHGM